ncbi:MAG: ATP synthase F1 subunit epsilon [Burkholderiaceae bacterium]|jgi:ATP synthase F1 epsilon subunit|nr:ATP synthase F1 subunit epsilon [Burkholderiaceae bacterium]
MATELSSLPAAVSRGGPAFRLLIATFDNEVFDGQVTYVDLPGIAGHVGVLKRHTPLLTLLADGPLTLHPLDGPPRTLPVMGGIAEVGPRGVTVLADFAGRDVEAEKQRMDAARERSVTRHARQPRGDAAPGALFDRRTRLDDELSLFLIRTLRDLKR